MSTERSTSPALTFTRISKLLALTICLTLVLNMNLNGLSTALGSGISFDKEDARFASIWQLFSVNSIVRGLLEEAESAGVALDMDRPFFAPVTDNRGNEATTVSVSGKRGKDTILITGYFEQLTGDLVLAHSLLFYRDANSNLVVESIVYSGGELIRGSATYNEQGMRFESPDEETFVRGPSGISFRQPTLANSYACQRTECEWTYQFAQIIICGLVALALGGVGGFLCGLATYAVPQYICRQLYAHCP